MSDSSNVSSTSSGVVTAVQAFLILEKLNVFQDLNTPISEWSWWWVLAPTWISLLTAVILGAILGFIAAIKS